MDTQEPAVQVLTHDSLFDSIVAFVSGVSFFVVQTKRKLKCAQPPPGLVTSVALGETSLDRVPEDVELWQLAVRNGDKRTLEALHQLATMTSDLGKRVRVTIAGIYGFAVLLTRDSGDMALLEWIHSAELFQFEWIRSDAVLSELGERGDLTMLRWLHEYGCSVNVAVAIAAASSGNLDVLQFVQSVGLPRDLIAESALMYAAANGQLRVIEFLIQQNGGSTTRHWARVAFASAIQADQLPVVQYLHANGYECEHDDIKKAAHSGHVDVVPYMLEHEIGTAATDALDRAARFGHLEVVELLCASGWVVSNNMVYSDVIKRNRFDILRVLCEIGIDGAVERAMAAAVKLGKVEFVKFLFGLAPASCADKGDSLLAEAVKGGHLDVIQFFHDCGGTNFSNWRAMSCAVANGNLDIVKFLCASGRATCSEAMFRRAMQDGRSDIVEVLCESLGSGAVSRAMRAAVELGKLQFVESVYAFDPRASYPGKDMFLSGATKRGQLDILKFFHECGDNAFFNKGTMQTAVTHGRLDIVQFLHENRNESCSRHALEVAYNKCHYHVVDFLCEHRPTLNVDVLVELTRRK